MQPLVPGYAITGELSSCAAGMTGTGTTGTTWAAVRTADDLPVVLKVVPVSDVASAQVQAAELVTVLGRIGNEHLVRQHGVIALADGTLALVLDQVAGGGLARLLGARGKLTPGETVTTVAPLFGALADLHDAGVVHGCLKPESVLFTADGRPLICDLGAAWLGTPSFSADQASGLVAPEVVAGKGPSAASDVYSMAALGWFCLTGAPPAPASTRRSLSTLRPGTPARLVEVLTSCLSADPTARPGAGEAAFKVFDGAPAESVVLTSAADPATEITRRIRAAATPALAPEPPSITQRLRRPLVIGVAALVVAAVVGGGATWLFLRPTVAVQTVAVRSSAQPGTPPGPATIGSATIGSAPSGSATSASATTPTAGSVAAATTPRSMTDVVTAPNSPRVAAARLLQALVDARALAYVARNPALLDLVYASGAARAGADRSNITTAIDNGATYLGLAFVVKDVAFLDATSDTARIRATIVTPAYKTGQPDGRKVPHAQEIVPPAVFTLNLTRDGWRILTLSAP